MRWPGGMFLYKSCFWETLQKVIRSRRHINLQNWSFILVSSVSLVKMVRDDTKCYVQATGVQWDPLLGCLR